MMKILENKKDLERKAGRFVIDRCPVDLFHLWLRKNLFHLEADTRLFYDKCQSFTQDYDFIILSAWGHLDLFQIEGESSRQKRTMNPWVQFSNHVSISGIAHLWLPSDKIIHLPNRKTSVDENVHFVSEKIKDFLNLPV